MLIIIPNWNPFRIANEKTTFADAFEMADQVLCSGIACFTTLWSRRGSINLDFVDVCWIMGEMGTAMTAAKRRGTPRTSRRRRGDRRPAVQRCLTGRSPGPPDSITGGRI